MKKTSTYLFTRIGVALFVVIGLILASFPGIYAKTLSTLVGTNEVIFETFIPTYKAIFGGEFKTNLVLNHDYLSLANELEVTQILNETITLNIKTNVLILIFFILSLISLILFLIKAKSRIVSLITTIIFIITTITFATSNLSFNMSTSSSILFDKSYECSLGFMFLTLTYAVSTTILMFHLFRLLIKPNSLQLDINQN